MSYSQSTYVPDWLDKRAKLTPDRIGLVEGVGGSEITFRDWNARVNRTANYLRSLGVQKGDRVSVYASNCAEYLDVFWAAVKLGFILHNLNWRLTVHELRRLVADAEPIVLLYGEDWREQVDELRPSFTTIRDVVAFGGAGADERSFGEREAMSDTLDGRPELEMDDILGIYYTGGTTGLPKGAILTHGNLTWNSVNTTTSWGIHGGHVAALQLPFFHIGGPNIFMVPLVHTGGTTILCSAFDLDETFELIDRGAVTHYVGVPTMYQMLQADPRWAQTDFSKLDLVISGGAPCPLPIMEKFWDKGIDFKMGYGLTEAAGNNFWLPPERVRDKTTSVGYPLFHIDMKVVDETGKEVGPNETGELLIKGPHVTPGYWNQPEATADTIKDGWLWTGDLAVRDDEGFFTIKGRSKDMFISGGENVYPAEVESVMLAYEGVTEAALVGIPDEKWGEIGRAFLVVDEGGDFDDEAFLGFLGERLAEYKLPRSVIVLAELPKTVIGKLDKKVMAAMEVAE
ncbi:MAG: long-chain fatty acid--CoA ligase [Acidimicrobiia bacterium]|nr:long-chain fatty acid--CoA ligase [Acidimicrobiia bacterium]MBT8191836.1 long-chain fatty acid--CoA ligase [Acidimicrobiia bacterium]NNF89156.1 long-chain fatty acid--CoA ligase [Acidimicrobiia bacterium]NNL14923.1 long-chain fatty acid--CoA ligase [Acidimicrobiia bacterium]RZV46472.1 MAG: long-chain fatty acid--CoA ligase [Acidimicrobiia bacterium]